MGEKTGIEWTRGDDGQPGATWNPVRGCTRVSPGCVNCYAEVMAARFSEPGQWGHGFAEMKGGDHRWTGKVELVESQLALPLRWQRARRIFVNSTSDLFHERLPDDVTDKIFAVMALAPQHTFQVLTKRPERMRAYCSSRNSVLRIYNIVCDLVTDGGAEGVLIAPGIDPTLAPPGKRIFLDQWPLPNVWLGVSAERQQEADERIPVLLDTPAAIRFISAEPLLGLIDLTSLRNSADLGEGQPWLNALGAHGAGYVYQEADTCTVPRLDWVIVGGESGPHARPMHPDWARSLRDHCNAAGVPFFFKQWGEWAPHTPVAGGDLGGSVRSGRVTIVHPRRTDIEIFRESGGSRSTEPGSTYMARVGKNTSGRILDGREWNEMPEARAA